MKEAFDRLVDHFMSGGFFLQEAVELLEKTMIARALDRTAGKKSSASKILGIHRNTLQKKMVDYKLDAQPVERKPVRRVKAAARRKLAG